MSLVCSSLTIEGQIIFHAMIKGRRMGFENIIIEMDCATLHGSVLGNSSTFRWNIEALLHDIFHKKTVSLYVLSILFLVILIELEIG